MEKAETKPETSLMTAEQLARLPEDGFRYELVAGRLVRMSPTGRRHSLIALSLVSVLHQYVREHALGEVLMPETGFVLSQPGERDTVRAPDVAFVRAERIELLPEDGYPRLAPDLAAEVASPSQPHAELVRKASEWLAAGTNVVWLIFPDDRTVEVWPSEAPMRRIRADGSLEGEDVLPGFVLPVAALFAGLDRP